MNSEPEVKENVQAEQAQEESMSVESVEPVESDEITLAADSAEASAEVTDEVKADANIQENTEVDTETSEESAVQDKETIKKKMQAFGQKLSVGHVVALMMCFLSVRHL